MIASREELEFVVADHRTLTGDLYRPEGPGPFPIVIGIHGGNWNQGSRKAYRHWGPLLAQNGFALFAVDRRNFEPGETAYPAVIEDFREAVRFIGTSASALRLDADRIALMGASSGAYIASMVGLGHGGDADALPVVKAVVAAYGVYDLAAEWSFEQVTRPLDKSVEWLLGAALFDDRALYFDASPISHCIRANNRTSFLVAWGTEDNVVSERLHSEPFVRALTLAGFDVGTCILPFAQHYWLFEPLDQVSSHSAAFAPRLLRFLSNAL